MNGVWVGFVVGFAVGSFVVSLIEGLAFRAWKRVYYGVDKRYGVDSKR